MPTDDSRNTTTWSVRSPADLGRAIAGARQLKGLTQEEFAEELCVQRSYLSQLETGEATLALERSLRALRRLGADVSVRFSEPDARRS